MLYYRVKTSADGARRGTRNNPFYLVKNEILTESEMSLFNVHSSDVEEVLVKPRAVYCFFGARFYDEKENAQRLYTVVTAPRLWKKGKRAYKPGKHTVAGFTVWISKQRVIFGDGVNSAGETIESADIYKKTRSGWERVNGLTVDAFYHGIKRGTVKLAESASDPALV